MSSRSAAIADAIAAWLNDPQHLWSLNFEASRTWVPETDYQQLGSSLLVEVVPTTLAAEDLQSRGSEEQDVTLFIGVRQRYPDGGDIPDSWIDERVNLTELIANRLGDLQLEDQGEGIDVYTVSVTIDPLADDQGLRNERSYVGVITLVMREDRPRG